MSFLLVFLFAIRASAEDAGKAPLPPGGAPPGWIRPTIHVNELKLWRRPAESLEGIASRTLGLHGVGTRDLPPGGAHEYQAGLALNLRSLALMDYRALDLRYVDALELGASSAGWLYRAEMQLSAGPRWRWSDTVAGVARVGARARVARTGGFFVSDVRAPLLDLGVRVLSSTLQLDTAFEIAPVLVGSLEWSSSMTSLKGGRADSFLLSAAWRSYRVDSEVVHFVGSAGAERLEVRGSACGYTGWGFLCADGGTITSIGGPSGGRQLTLGLSILLGRYEWLYPKK